jgi:hypothetical protein
MPKTYTTIETISRFVLPFCPKVAPSNTAKIYGCLQGPASRPPQQTYV